jgi:hypothetical protein
MTPKEKAIELVDKFNKPDTTHYPYVHNAQQCALIAVNEILEISEHESPSTYVYYMEVKKEIEAL